MKFSQTEFSKSKELAKERVKKAASSISTLPFEIFTGLESWVRSLFNSVERKEFNFDGIKNDVQTIINDPKKTKEILSKRFSMYDKESLIAIISKNPGIAPEDADRIISKFETTRDSIIDKVKAAEAETRKKLEETKARILAQLNEQK